jgi:hypothetical protein
VPNNHSKYRIILVLVSDGALVNCQRYHRSPGVEPTNSVAGETIHLRVRGGEERLGCRRCRFSRHTRQQDLPVRGLQLRRLRHGQVSDLDHVNPVWQGCVEPVPDVSRIEALGERNLQVLGFAGGTCRSAA